MTHTICLLSAVYGWSDAIDPDDPSQTLWWRNEGIFYTPNIWMIMNEIQRLDSCHSFFTPNLHITLYGFHHFVMIFTWICYIFGSICHTSTHDIVTCTFQYEIHTFQLVKCVHFPLYTLCLSIVLFEQIMERVYTET